MKLDLAFNLITTDPRTLLDNAYVSLSGGGNAFPSQLAWFSISKPVSLQGFYTRAGSNALIPSFQVMVYDTATPLQPKFKDNNGEDHFSFSAFYIAMRKMAPVGSKPAGTHQVLPANGNVDICITSQLSGCTFGIGSQGPGGCCLVSHIQPSGNLAVAQPIMATQTEVLFGTPPVKLVQKGAANDYTDRAHVIGQRSHGIWNFFIQKFQSFPIHAIEPVADI